MPWTDLEPTLRDRAYRRIDAMPELLLETDVWGSPDCEDAELIYARLIGIDGEIVKDGLCLPRVEHHILMHIPQRLATFTDEIAPGVYKIDGVEIWMPPAVDPMPVAEYTLQSCFTTLFVSGEYHPPVEKLRPDFTAKVAYLRYRRRS